MDLKQRKLTKAEWETIETPVSNDESIILRLITNGFSNVNITTNKTDSIFTHLKIEYNPQIEKFLYIKFFADKIKTLVDTYGVSFICFDRETELEIKRNNNDETNTHIKIYCINLSSIIKLKSSDQIRLASLNSTLDHYENMYEFILFKNLEKMVQHKHNDNKKWVYYYYTLTKLLKNSIEKVNCYIKEVIDTFIINYESEVDLLYIVKNSVNFIEKNTNLLKYSDLRLYNHQKDIFTAINAPEPKLILYIAPTGTGKTLTPLGLSEKYKVIFVCAARHVGLALARSSISIGKKIAFAFGCSSAEDVRLHYFAAKDYTKDRRSGQIRKVDNAVGDKVEIMICDIRSYLSAMFYMASFNAVENIVTYWDEPTITMDYEQHELHSIIQRNWRQNIIPNMVLSSATLPKLYELTETIADFKEKFPNAIINNIVSYECNKSIPLINNNGYVIMPHYIEEDYSKILQMVVHCEENLTMLRYFDLNEAAIFIHYVEINNYNKPISKFDRNFASIDNIDMKSIKLYYLKVLKNIMESHWETIVEYFRLIRTRKIMPNNSVDSKGNATNVDKRNGEKITRIQSLPIIEKIMEEPAGSSGIYITTKDAYTLTDGPTIFLANDLQKITKFCIQQANIPTLVMKNIMEKIEYNNHINERIDQIEKDLEFEEEKLASKLEGDSSGSSSSSKKNQGKSKMKIANKIIDKTDNNKIVKMKDDILTLRSMIKNATIDDIFVPNKLLHLNKWASNVGIQKTNAFTSNIEENIIVSIMSLKDVEDSWKILLLLGIGVFTEHKSIAYTEIMKKLADQQKLYLIIADSDYIYGTNYQFCHCYLSKDLLLTQEKIIQAMGRVGRNNIQQEYSIRFRDDSQVKTLFTRFDAEQKPEVINMNQLLNSKNVRWNGMRYEEISEV
jgi:hypothetical protein